MHQEYRQQLAARLGASAGDIFPYWKGRVALFALLKAMGIGRGDEVVMPAFTCVVVPNAVLYAGATPVYVDIDPISLNPSAETIAEALSERTRCVLVQNTFGLSTEVEAISDLARQRDLLTIEDCTHGFGGTHGGQPNGSFCDAAFYSTQWNKPFSTGLGGFAWVRRTEIREKLHAENTKLLPPTLKQRLMLDMLVRINRAFVNDRSYWFLMNTYRALSKRGLVLGSSSGGEIASTRMPQDYFLGASEVQARHGLRALREFDALLALRRKNGLHYNHILRQWGKFNYPDALLADHAFLKFPVFVHERPRFIEAAARARIRLGDWFCSMLHPVEGSLEAWGLDPARFPVARQAAATILNLPTDTRQRQRVEDFLASQLEALAVRRT